MKDENEGAIMTEFVGLRAKMYSYRVQTKKLKFESKRAKGVKKHIVNKKLTFDDFLKCVEENTRFVGAQSLIKSKMHKVHTIQQNKILLDASDDKRFLIKNKTSTLAWGHSNCSENK